jgi:thiol-disulfide isomerase/thioredoxin
MALMGVHKLVLASITALIVALLFTIKETVDKPIVEPGRTAPKFSFKTDDGFAIARDEFGGKLLVLNFWASWCSPGIERNAHAESVCV